MPGYNSNTKIKLGIVTVSLNQAAFLQEAIDSVTVSTAARLQYVMVDPGSRDGSREIIENNRGLFTKVIFEKDRGPADGLNKGFAACDADVFGYLNSDDRFTPGALDFVAGYFARNSEIDLLLGAIRIIDRNAKPALRGRAPDRIDIPKFVAGACFAWQQATFFRRSLFERTGGFNPENRACWDGELILDMAIAGARIGYTNTILGDFRIHGDSLTGSGRQAEWEKPEILRFKQKATAAGYKLLSPQKEMRERFKYKYNPLRHLRCAAGIALPPLIADSIQSK